MTKTAAKTGVGPTMTVAIEQHLRLHQYIVDDDLANRILPRGDARGS